VKVDVHDRLEAIGPVAWSALVERTRLRSPFLSWIWQRESVRTFAAERRLEIRQVEDHDGQLVAVLPLYERAPGVWTLVGGAEVSDYLDLIALAGRETEAWTALLQSRPATPSLWELHAVPAASPTVTALPTLDPGQTVTVTVEERCPVLELPDTWETYLARLTSKHRHELTRKLRRLEREAPDARVTCLARRDEIDSRIGDFLNLHRRSRVGKERFMDPLMEGFFRRVAAELADAGGVRLWFLDVPSGPLASFITLEWDGTVGLYNSGFHPGAAAFSPGLVLLARIVEDAIVRTKRRFDFLRGEERYKYDFEPQAEEVYKVTIATGKAHLPTATGHAAVPEPRPSGYSPPSPVPDSPHPMP
jgi:CelD/BcsL family acetyltransferase involved in cellulose biosynthesis